MDATEPRPLPHSKHRKPDWERLSNIFTTRHWRWRYYPGDPHPKTLLEALKRTLPQISAASWSKRLWYGGIFLNGEPVFEDQPLSPPCQVEYYEPKYPLENAEKLFPAFHRRWVVFEDKDILVACKPAGLPSMPAREQRQFSLQRSLEEYTQKTIHMPSRLDRAASGLVLSAKSERAFAKAQQLFENRQVQKYYLLGTNPSPSWDSKTLSAPIAKDPCHPVLRRVCPFTGKRAITNFSVLQRKRSGSTLLLAHPETGRTHQLRVHCAELGVPIVGDNFYQGEKASALQLLAYALRFPHPLSQKETCVLLPEHLFPKWLQTFAFTPVIPWLKHIDL